MWLVAVVSLQYYLNSIILLFARLIRVDEGERTRCFILVTRIVLSRTFQISSELSNLINYFVNLRFCS